MVFFAVELVAEGAEGHLVCVGLVDVAVGAVEGEVGQGGTPTVEALGIFVDELPAADGYVGADEQRGYGFGLGKGGKDEA